jgi:hypothetical protein
VVALDQRDLEQVIGTFVGRRHPGLAWATVPRYLHLGADLRLAGRRTSNTPSPKASPPSAKTSVTMRQ